MRHELTPPPYLPPKSFWIALSEGGLHSRCPPIHLPSTVCSSRGARQYHSTILSRGPGNPTTTRAPTTGSTHQPFSPTHPGAVWGLISGAIIYQYHPQGQKYTSIILRHLVDQMPKSIKVEVYWIYPLQSTAPSLK